MGGRLSYSVGQYDLKNLVLHSEFPLPSGPNTAHQEKQPCMGKASLLSFCFGD